jgi:hypothetical protein
VTLPGSTARALAPSTVAWGANTLNPTIALRLFPPLSVSTCTAFKYRSGSNQHRVLALSKRPNNVLSFECRIIIAPEMKHDNGEQESKGQ